MKSIFSPSLEQHQATSPYHSCWVEASAGTGKTKVLTDRFINLLLTGCPPANILCLTFTKAAAAEMLNRIQEKLSHWAGLSLQELTETVESFLRRTPTTEEIQRAQGLFSCIMDKAGDMKIQTIHAFCQMILKKFPLEADVPPHFTVMGTSQSGILLKKAFQEAIESMEAPELRILAHHASPTQLFQLISSFLEEQRRWMGSVSRHFPLSLDYRLQKSYEALGFSSSPNPLHVLRTFLDFPLLPQPDFLKWLPILEGGTEGDKKTARFLKDWLLQPLSIRVDRFRNYMDIFLTTKGDVRKNLISKALGITFPHLLDFLQKEAQRMRVLREKYHHAIIGEATTSFLLLAHQCFLLYEQFKMREALLDYDDLITRTANLFQKPDMAPWVLYKLDGGIQHILVDEAQDTNRDQWEVIAAIATEFFSEGPNPQNIRTLFVVGDMKQSIYSFQGANPLAFQAVKNFFSASAQASNHLWKPVTLAMSFRSTEPILRLVDQVFQKYPFLSPAGFELTYRTHELHRHDHGGRVEVWPLVQSPLREEREPWAMPDKQVRKDSARKEVAHQIADRIHQWLREKRILPSKGRPIRSSDIMILVRRRDSFVEELVRALKKREIPVTGVDRLVLTEQIAIMDLLALGEFLLLPTNDLALASVLKSPLFSLGEDELFSLCYGRGEKSVWQILKEQGKEIAFYQEVVAILTDLMNRVDFCSVFEFYSYVLHTMGGRQKMVSHLGSEVEDPLEEFLNLTLTFQQEQGGPLQLFLSWIQEENTEIKRHLEQSNEDQVRIMTVHGAKGLQSPIVFLPDTTQIPAVSPSFFWDEKDLENPLVFWCPKSHLKTRALQEMHPQSDETAEYYRLLYVALTRAEDELYIAGWQPQRTREGVSWYEAVLSAIKECGSSFLLPQGEGWYLEKLSSHTVEKTPSLEEVQHLEEKLPAWVHQECKPETSNVVITPSSEEAFQDTSGTREGQGSEWRERGILIHKALEWLTPLPQCEQQSQQVSQQVKHWVFERVSALEQEEIWGEIQGALKLLERYLKNGVILTEVPIHSFDPERQGVVKGTLDFLWVDDAHQEVHIIDYKTGTFNPLYRDQPPLAYQIQMKLYCESVARLYPTYKIRSFILWTSVLELIEEKKSCIRPYD